MFLQGIMKVILLIRNEIVWDFVDSKCSAQSHVFLDAFKTLCLFN